MKNNNGNNGDAISAKFAAYCNVNFSKKFIAKFIMYTCRCVYGRVGELRERCIKSFASEKF